MVESYGDLKTFAGIFHNVFGMKFYTSYTASNFNIIDTINSWNLVAYYGKNIGLIGAGQPSNAGTEKTIALLTYAKIRNNVYGALFPAKDISATQMQKSKAMRINNWALNGIIYHLNYAPLVHKNLCINSHL